MDQETIHRRRWYILGVLIASLLVVVLDNTILNVALKTIADPEEGLGASQSDLEWAINSYILVFAGLLFSWGVLGDRIGRRRMLALGLAVFGIASLVSAYAQTPGQLIGARAVMGVGAAAVMPATLAIITNVFDAKERPKAIGIWAGAIGGAIAIGPITGGVLLAHFWWGSVFLVNVPIAALGIIAITFVVPESRDPSPGKVDPVGVVLSVVGLVALVYGIIKGGQLASFTEFDVLGPIFAGLILLAAFVLYERRTSHPSLDVSLFRDPRFTAAVAALALVFFALMGVIFFLAFYLQSVRGYTPLQAGLLILPLAVAQLVVAPRSHLLVNRFGPKVVCAAGLFVLAVCMGSYLFMDQSTPLWVLGVVYFAQGAAMGTVMPPATESIMSVLPREKAGAGSAVNNVVRQVSGAMGVAILGSILSASYRDQIEPHLSVLPEGIRHHAGESITSTLGVVESLGERGAGLVEPAKEAFVHAMHVTAVGSAIVAFLGALVVFTWLPGRPRSGGHAEEEVERENALV